MADLDQPIGADAGEGRHGQAAHMIDAALRARREGRADEADRLLAEAARVDPDAVTAALQAASSGSNPEAPSRSDPEAAGTASDEEVAAISREVLPGSAAPSRSGIAGSSSGSDG